MTIDKLQKKKKRKEKLHRQLQYEIFD